MKAIVTKIFLNWEYVKILLSDRGQNFTLTLIKEVCKLLGVNKILTSPYKTQCDG